MKFSLRFFLTLLAVLPVINVAHAQQAPAARSFAGAYGPSNMGRDFWLALPASVSPSNTTNLYLVSEVPTQVRIWAGPTLVKTVQLAADRIPVRVELELSQAQMFVHNDLPPVLPDQIFRKKAVHIQADAPIAVLGESTNYYNGDILLALPLNALGREYIIGCYSTFTGGAQEIPSQYLITAPYNGTTVSIYHPHRTSGHNAGQTFTIKLESGDVFSAMTIGYGADMSGVIIRSDKPVAVTTGIACTTIPSTSNACCCGYLTEMMRPVESWGKVYQAMPFKTRSKGEFYRIFAKEPGTTVSINGQVYKTLDTIGGVEGKGWFEYRAPDKDPQEFVADKPIMVTQYCTTREYDRGAPGQKSIGPFFMVLTPVGQFSRETIFSRQFISGYENHQLIVICQAEHLNEIEIGTMVTDEWQPLSSLPGASDRWDFQTDVNGVVYSGITVDITNPYLNRLRGPAEFASYVYAYDVRSSTDPRTLGAYPVGLATRNLGTGDTIAPTITRQEGCDGTVIGTVSDEPDPGGVSATLSTVEMDPNPASTSNYEFQLTPFQPGLSTTTGYKLVVIDPARPAYAVVVASDMAGNFRLDTVVYGSQSSVGLPAVRDYGKIRVGEKQTSTVTITNESQQPLEFEKMVLKNGAEGFRVAGPVGKVILGPKGSASASIQVLVEFTARIDQGRAMQVYEDSVGVKDSCGTHYKTLVRAQVTKPMIHVSDHDFGKVTLNSRTDAWGIEVTNVSEIAGSTLTIKGLRGPGTASVFSASWSKPLPLKLEPGERALCMVTGFVMDQNPHTDTIYFESDALDIADGDDYAWLRIEGEGIAGIRDQAEHEESVLAMNIAPNPAGSEYVDVYYTLAHESKVNVEIVDAAGKVVKDIWSEGLKPVGIYHVNVKIADLPAGTYLVHVTAGTERKMKHLVIVR